MQKCKGLVCNAQMVREIRFLNLCATFAFLLQKGRLLGFYFGRWLLAFGLFSSRHAGHTYCWSC